MNANLIRLSRAALLASVLLAVPATSQATVLVPGGAVMPEVLSGSAGTLVDTVLTPLTSGGEIVARMRAAVVMNSGGTLDFYYQVFNAGTSGHNFDFTLSQSFATGATFATNVFYRLENGGLPVFLPGNADATPSDATRSNDGTVVGFEFTGSPLQYENRINPGENSRILVIRTNATSYVGGLTTIGNTISLTAPSFAPSGFAPSSVPEPASLLLLGSAFAAAGYAARHRAKKKPTV
jgi:PEP-CTERM motif